MVTPVEITHRPSVRVNHTHADTATRNATALVDTTKTDHTTRAARCISEVYADYFATSFNMLAPKPTRRTDDTCPVTRTARALGDALLSLRDRLDGTTGDRLVFQSLSRLSLQPDFSEVFHALIASDRELHAGINEASIRATFEGHGLPTQRSFERPL